MYVWLGWEVELSCAILGQNGLGLFRLSCVGELSLGFFVLFWVEMHWVYLG